mmetsp:Transcript_32878/g.81847  ORF Transcript_32878/g.81847 Transcript_32878/m.81847 type:complete len:281 (-) Transcript_32878:1963-2805(-)
MTTAAFSTARTRTRSTWAVGRFHKVKQTSKSVTKVKDARSTTLVSPPSRRCASGLRHGSWRNCAARIRSSGTRVANTRAGSILRAEASSPALTANNASMKMAESVSVCPTDNAQLTPTPASDNLRKRVARETCATSSVVFVDRWSEERNHRNRSNDPTSKRCRSRLAAIDTTAILSRIPTCSQGVCNCSERTKRSAKAAAVGTRMAAVFSTRARQRSGCDLHIFEWRRQPYAASIVSTNGSMELMPDTRRPMLPTAVASNKPTKQSVTTRFASISCPSMM